MTNNLKKIKLFTMTSPICSNLAHTSTYAHGYISVNFWFQGHRGHGIWVM